MVSQCVGQMLCGYGVANDCSQHRGDCILKMSEGLRPTYIFRTSPFFKEMYL